VCKKSMKNSQPFVKKNGNYENSLSGDLFDSHYTNTPQQLAGPMTMILNTLPDQLHNPSGNKATFTRLLKTHTLLLNY